MRLEIALAYVMPDGDAAITIDPKRPAQTGVPRVIFHGTARPMFQGFAENHQGDHDFGWIGTGFYFTTSWGHAKAYADTFRRREKTKIARVVAVEPKAGLKLYPINKEEHAACFQISVRKDTKALAHSKALAAQLRAAGYDGSCYTHPSGERFIEIMLLDRGGFRVVDEDARSQDMEKNVPAVSLSKSKSKSRATAWVFVYNERRNQFLMLQRAPHTNNPLLWNIPGGGTDGSAPDKGAKRELLEEAGLRVRRKELIHLGRIPALDADYFLVKMQAQPLLQIDPAESSDHRWLNLHEMLAMGKKLHKKTSTALRNPAILAVLGQHVNLES